MGIMTGLNIYSRVMPWTKSSGFKSDVSAFMCLIIQFVIYLVMLLAGMAGVVYTGALLSLLPHNLLKLYSKIINENNYKDHLHIACNKVFVMVRELPKKAIESYDKRQRKYKNKRR